MDLNKKAKEILNDKLNEHKHRMADALFGSTEEMVLDAIKQALTLTSVGVRSEQFKNDGTYTYQYWTEKYFIKLSKDKYKAKGNNYGIVYYTERELRGKYARQYRK